jgi:hypothetical protein
MIESKIIYIYIFFRIYLFIILFVDAFIELTLKINNLHRNIDQIKFINIHLSSALFKTKKYTKQIILSIQDLKNIITKILQKCFIF